MIHEACILTNSVRVVVTASYVDATSTMHVYTLMYSGKTTHFVVCVLSSKGVEILVDAYRVQIVFQYANVRRGRRAPVYCVCHCSGAVHGSTFPMLAASWVPGLTFLMLAALSNQCF